VAENRTRPLVLVTGAAGALGGVLVRYLAARGQRVVAIDRPQASGALAEVARDAPGVIPIELDATSAETWSPVMEHIVADHGVPHGAVLVAGGYRGGRHFSEGDANATFKAMMDLNAASASAALAALLGPMVGSGRGSIVMVGSRAGVRPWESAGSAAYAASKAAVVALVQAVAAEVLAAGVRINAVLPSTIDTPQNRSSMPDADPSRWVSPGSLCDVIGFLLSDAARDVSGAALPVYGKVGV
jgi:NAD(P)-dependent dehydrogenase (short-subunit alcohol dehydrogenase family)